MRRFAAISLLLLTASLGATLAHAEIECEGDVCVKFGGDFAPRALPRDRDVPVTVHLHTSFKTPEGGRPPHLRRISFAVNRYGRISTAGLPTCRASLLESTDPATALSRCRPALVGQGDFYANVEFPDRPPFPVHGRMLAFNGRSHGRPAILLHIHGSTPVDVTVILTFTIHHPAEGKFGTVLATRIPRLASDLGYVTRVSLTFNRIYRYEGERRSFLSARCAAPAGFPGAIFSFTRGTFVFAGEREIATTLTRNCRVR
jgi:hypothetical protein